MNHDPKDLLEAAIFSAGEPIAPEKLLLLFQEQTHIDLKQVKVWLAELAESYSSKPIELRQVASGYRFQVRSDFAPEIQRMQLKKAPKYSRALLETLSLIIYKQPITRGEIEEVRGVAVSTNIIKTLQERDWIRVVGHREVPGKPALFGTTKAFLDYFNLTQLSDLPDLEDVVDLDQVGRDLNKQLSLNVNPDDSDLPTSCPALEVESAPGDADVCQSDNPPETSDDSAEGPASPGDSILDSSEVIPDGAVSGDSDTSCMEPSDIDSELFQSLGEVNSDNAGDQVPDESGDETGSDGSLDSAIEDDCLVETV